jgi:DegV family protein with EDD domain
MSEEKIAIVTDSSAYIPDKVMQGLDIHVIPLCLVWDNEEFQDGVEMLPEMFYRRLKGSKTLPTTSQPSPGEFEDLFRSLEKDFSAVVNVLASSKISGTVTSAKTAKSNYTGIPIEIVDSHMSSMGLGFSALAAARAAAAECSLEEVVAAAIAMREKVKLLFVVDTLEYLQRGGRISIAKRFLGTALQIKPILHFNNATIEPLSSARTRKKALAHMLDLIETQLMGKVMQEACIVNIDCRDEATSLADVVQSRFNPDKMFHADVSPVVGTQVGPGGLGVSFYPKD